VIKTKVARDIQFVVNLIDASAAGTVTLLQLQNAYASIAGNLTIAKAEYDTKKAWLVGNITAKLEDWKTHVASLTANRSIAVDSVKTFVQRAKAVFFFEVAKLEARAIALGLVVLRSWGQAAELQFRLWVARLIVINNTIYTKDPTAITIPWTAIPKVTLVTKLAEVGIAAEVAIFRATKLTTVVAPAVLQEIVQAYKDLATKVANFLQNLYAKLQDLKAKWQANKAQIIADIANRTRDFLENVNQTIVDIVIKADGNITLAIQIIRNDLNGEVRAAVKQYIIDHLKILLAAYIGAQDSNVTVVASDPSAKRYIADTQETQSTWPVTVEIGTLETSDPSNTDSAGAVIVASIGLVVAVVAALLL